MSAPGIVANVAKNAALFNVIAANPLFKIHPAVGVARVGDSPSAFFIGPERPHAGATGAADGVGSAVPSFRDGGKMKRQAARFRIFNYPPAGAPEEINLDHPQVKAIKWTVHLVNAKAAFFEFQGQTGAAGPYAAPPPLRNPTVPGPFNSVPRKTKLVIDPGPREISGRSQGPIKFDPATTAPIDPKTKSPHPQNWPKKADGKPVIDYLGELLTDAQGRLLVLGGRGKSVSSNALPPSGSTAAIPPPGTQMRAFRDGWLGPASVFAGPPTGPVRPRAPILEYANNDTWFDDVSDGSVTAQVTLKSGKVVPVQFPAWVMVGPPDFAPEIRSVVSLYDTMLDVAVRKLALPAAPFYSALDLAELQELKKSFGGGVSAYQPEWFNDIEPMLMAGFGARYVHQPAQPFHASLSAAKLQSFGALDKPTREGIFNFLRKPAGNTTYSGSGSMPKLLGDNFFTPGDPRRVLAVTETQYHILKLWKDGTFILGAGGPSPLFTPDGLDRASLEGCVGGAFFPGIECSWLVREAGIYMEPFRIKHGAKVGPLTVTPGFFSQQMALPWQADFLDCSRDDSLGVAFGWWPAQRPDDVYLTAADAAAGGAMTPWFGPRPAGRSLHHEDMVDHWDKAGFVISSMVGGKKVFSEIDRLPMP